MKLSKKQLAEPFDIDIFYETKGEDNIKTGMGCGSELSVWRDGQCFIFRWGVEQDIILIIKDNRQFIEVADSLEILDKNEWL